MSIKTIKYYAPGDGRKDANLAGQKSQMAGEKQAKDMAKRLGIKLVRLHPEVDKRYGHGFIQDPVQAREVFSKVGPDDAIMAFLTQWAFNDRTGPYLWEHKGPKLIKTNYDGSDPGLVGAMGLRSVAAMELGVENISFVWSSESFKDEPAVKWMTEFRDTGKINHSALRRYKVKYDSQAFNSDFAPAIALGRKMAEDYQKNPRIAGVYDIGCMGMLNAAWLHRDLKETGVKMDQVTQVELSHRMGQISREEAIGYMQWKMKRGYDLRLGLDARTDITDFMVVDAGQMYGGHVKFSAERGWDTATISFQTGMNSSHSSSDDPEATANSPQRPPVIIDGRVFKKGRSVPLRNEADICMMIDCLYMESIAEAAGKDTGIKSLIGHMGGSATAYKALSDPRQWVATGHDVRWSDMAKATPDTPATYGDNLIKNFDAHVVALNLSGNMPVEHTKKGFYNPRNCWGGFKASRHAWKYFPKGGICTEGLARTGEMIWARSYMIQGKKYMDIGRAGAINLHPNETERMWSSISRNWPLNEAVMYGISRDELMAGHMSNHISVMYAPDAVSANILMISMAEMVSKLGFEVNICGKYAIQDTLQYKAAKGIAVEGPGIRQSA